MSGLIEKLKAGQRNVRIVTFPGTDEMVGIRVLSEGDIQEAAFWTERRFKENKIEYSAATVGVYLAENNTQVLFRALVNPARKEADGSHALMFASDDELRWHLTPDAKAILVDEYNAHQEECSPSVAALSQEELDALVEGVKKNRTIGTDLSSNALRQLISFMAGQLATLPKASGSTSMP